MSDKKYDEDDLKRFANIIGESFAGQLAKLVENIDSRIAYHIEPVKKSVSKLESDMVVVKAAIKATNKDVKGLQVTTEKLETTTGKLEKITGKLETAASRLESAVKTNSEDIRSLNKAVDKAGHRVDVSLKFSESAYHEARSANRADRRQLEDHEARLLRLETA